MFILCLWTGQSPGSTGWVNTMNSSVPPGVMSGSESPSKPMTPRRANGGTSANSSVTTTPIATPSASRRSGGGPPPVSANRRNSRTSPSPVRRGGGGSRSVTPASVAGKPAASEPGAYSLSLPRTLYGDDINGNIPSDMMTQVYYASLPYHDDCDELLSRASR